MEIHDDEPDDGLHHPHLFEEIRHLKPDYFISGNPDEPDHTEECWDEYRYWNELDILRGYIHGKSRDQS